MIYHVLLAKGAQKELDNLPKRVGLKIYAKLETLAENPRPAGCKKLEGSKNSFRIRIGDYRVVYSVYDTELIVEVIKVGHRREVYR